MVCGGVVDELLGERGHDIVRSGTSERSGIKNRCVSGESGNVGTALGWASCCLVMMRIGATGRGLGLEGTSVEFGR